MKVDMSPQAITLRLKQTSELRKLCIALGGQRLKKRQQMVTVCVQRTDPDNPVAQLETSRGMEKELAD